MEAHTRRLKELFQAEVQYRIPEFQRPYVWNQENQWEPLWEDLRNTTENFIEALEALDEDTFNREAIAEEETGSHFMGAIVLQQIPRPAAEVGTWSIIDGQQRMMTLQVSLHAARNALMELGFERESKTLGRLVVNQYAEADDSFKVWPSALDREAFRKVMSDHGPTSSDSKIGDAHDFFFTQIKEWITAEPSEERQTLLVHGLETTLLGLLELVVIDLGVKDDPYVIFETLNARGTPLISSDLVKNLVLQTAERVGLDPHLLYSDHWRLLEDDWWREEVRQGRLIRPRVDVLLNYWLIAETADEVPSHQVFKSFKGLISDAEQKVVDVTADLIRNAEIYRTWDDEDPHSDLGTFLYRWRVLDAGVTTPLLLLLFDHLAGNRDELLRSTSILESFLVRRMVCRMTTKDYNRMFLELISQIKESEESPSVVMARFLLESDSDSRVWPSDVTVRRALGDLPLYRMLTRGRLRMILETLEDDLRGPKTEDEYVKRGKLTIEHIMPQQWRNHWPPPSGPTGEDDDPEARRDRMVHTIGNLTLVTKSLNPSMSNGPWHEKREALQLHGVLLLNSELIGTYGHDSFQDSSILERSRLLADRACTIWPIPG